MIAGVKGRWKTHFQCVRSLQFKSRGRQEANGLVGNVVFRWSTVPERQFGLRTAVYKSKYKRIEQKQRSVQYMHTPHTQINTSTQVNTNATVSERKKPETRGNRPDHLLFKKPILMQYKTSCICWCHLPWHLRRGCWESRKMTWAVCVDLTWYKRPKSFIFTAHSHKPADH